ncbi:response regulator [Singulisphaera acidiphila]|uniref:Response regulatory domain-containing protein n=1 Tax=Singulisphaera acidiphila (strain ATCC BAA-1392 / DSM 18658 / VKM B-2454 / MOB10) TaxID=886293 RepID=L0DD11_SINAD|nr:hypothetical protein [Singulisphaera acidiphila]AGA27132.1 hypothetical protein Sinac_2840 [Singulisphaera acidiphila DSM 18658]
MAVPRILSVGQCGYDHGNLTRALAGRLNAQITAADTFDDALSKLRTGNYNLLLVNRVTDLDGSHGLELIQAVKADPLLAGTPTMLVSDLANAQEEAVSLGALPGFGKSAMNDPKTLSRIEASLVRTEGS